MSALKILRVWSVGACLVIALGLLVLFVPSVVQAQSEPVWPTCRTCHIWEDPVVERGEWHTIHALQINCCTCHGGNDRATDQAGAHAGMTSNPLNSPQHSCQHCHPVDYQQRTAGVAVALGLAPGTQKSIVHPSSAVSPSASPSMTPWPQITLRGWDWPVELAVTIVVIGLGVMRWRRVHPH